MKHWRRASVIGTLILVGAALWAACNSDGTSGGTFAASCGGLEKLSRYRYTYFYKLETPQPTGPVDENALGDPPFALLPNSPDFMLSQRFNGDFVAPDRFFIQFETPSQPGSQPLLTTIIGDKQWVNPGGLWSEGVIPNPFTPAAVCNAVIPELDLADVPFTTETVNGRETRHFRIEGSTLRIIATLYGPESDMGRLLTTPSVDVWITGDGWPAKLTIKGQAEYPSGRELLMEISLDVRDANANDIKVEPPL